MHFHYCILYCPSFLHRVVYSGVALLIDVSTCIESLFCLIIRVCCIQHKQRIFILYMMPFNNILFIREEFRTKEVPVGSTHLIIRISFESFYWCNRKVMLGFFTRLFEKQPTICFEVDHVLCEIIGVYLVYYSPIVEWCSCWWLFGKATCRIWFEKWCWCWKLHSNRFKANEKDNS